MCKHTFKNDLFLELWTLHVKGSGLVGIIRVWWTVSSGFEIIMKSSYAWLIAEWEAGYLAALSWGNQTP